MLEFEAAPSVTTKQPGWSTAGVPQEYIRSTSGAPQDLRSSTQYRYHLGCQTRKLSHGNLQLAEASNLKVPLKRGRVAPSGSVASPARGGARSGAAGAAPARWEPACDAACTEQIWMLRVRLGSPCPSCIAKNNCLRAEPVLGLGGSLRQGLSHGMGRVGTQCPPLQWVPCSGGQWVPWAGVGSRDRSHTTPGSIHGWVPHHARLHAWTGPTPRQAPCMDESHTTPGSMHGQVPHHTRLHA